MAPRSAWAMLYWLPVRRRHQLVFAEALSQALAAGLDISPALWLAADCVPSRRLRAALREMVARGRTGYTLEASLAKTGVGVGGDLLAALRIGEETGRLSEHLAGFARRCDPRAATRLATAVGRPAETTRFASALAGLLKDHRLTIDLIEDAACLAGGAGSKFAVVVSRVVDAMKNGATFSEALAGAPSYFDPLFCQLAAVPDGRAGLRAVLERLGGDATGV